jgi:hypothetical protein
MSDMMMEEVLGIEAKKLLLKCLKLIEDSVAAKGAFLLNCFLKKFWLHQIQLENIVVVALPLCYFWRCPCPSRIIMESPEST